MISSDKEYKSKIIVNAAGAWADQIATLASVKTIGLKALKRSMVRIPAPANLNVRTWPFLFGTNEDWYARPDAGQLLISPSEEQLSEPHDAWAEDLVLAAGINRYEKFVTEKVADRAQPTVGSYSLSFVLRSNSKAIIHFKSSRWFSNESTDG